VGSALGRLYYYSLLTIHTLWMSVWIVFLIVLYAKRFESIVLECYVQAPWTTVPRPNESFGWHQGISLPRRRR
jgi:hypothetical protein